MAGIQDILIITTPHDQESFIKLLWDGSALGCHIQYAIQESPRWLADAFIVGESFIGQESVALILWDNIFYGTGMGSLLQQYTNPEWGVIFAYHVSDPQRYGVVTFDKNNTAISIEEKPQHPKSSYAVPGLYFYDNSVVSIAKNITPSARGELEITDINKVYLEKGNLKVGILDRGTAWLDTGTFDSLMQAWQFVQVIEERQWLKIGCVEEIAWRNGWINNQQLASLGEKYSKSWYGVYLTSLLQ